MLLKKLLIAWKAYKMGIDKVIICGLGALGLSYACRLKGLCELKILADENRILDYKKNPPQFNNNIISLEYISPEDCFDADLIIISTKYKGLNSAINFIKNFVKEKTIIISLINGISSEDCIKEAYPQANVVRSYFIGHSAIRRKNSVFQDGIGKIVFENHIELENFFKEKKISYEMVDDINYSMWLKLGVNIVLNELTSIYMCTVGELRKKEDYLDLSKRLLKEVKLVAEAKGIKNLDDYETKVLEQINYVSDDGLTSMYQDILAKRKTEVEIFSGEILRLGKYYGIKTFYNEEIYNKIKLLERNFE